MKRTNTLRPQDILGSLRAWCDKAETFLRARARTNGSFACLDADEVEAAGSAIATDAAEILRDVLRTKPELRGPWPSGMPSSEDLNRLDSFEVECRCITAVAFELAPIVGVDLLDEDRDSFISGKRGPRPDLEQLTEERVAKIRAALEALVPGGGRQVPQAPEGAFLAPADIAGMLYDQPTKHQRDAIRKTLDRWRESGTPKPGRDFKSNDDKCEHEPNYLYRWGAVKPLFLTDSASA